MNPVHLFRKRYLPDEMVELKDDKILLLTDDLIITRWNTLKPRCDISSGVSAYFMKKGVKLSKVFDKNGDLVYWYCDIIETQFDAVRNTYTFHDLLVDVLVYPDGHAEVLDLDEFADILEKGILPQATVTKALRITNDLLQLIYSGKFKDLTKYITETEQRECLELK